MKFTGRQTYDDGTKYNLLTCDCGHEMTVAQGANISIPYLACPKCKKATNQSKGEKS